jgi:hypothetical protein
MYCNSIHVLHKGFVSFKVHVMDNDNVYTYTMHRKNVTYQISDIISLKLTPSGPLSVTNSSNPFVFLILRYQSTSSSPPKHTISTPSCFVLFCFKVVGIEISVRSMNKQTKWYQYIYIEEEKHEIEIR